MLAKTNFQRFFIGKVILVAIKLCRTRDQFVIDK